MTTASLQNNYGATDNTSTANLTGEHPLHTHALPQLLFYMAVFTIPYYQWRHLVEGIPFMKIDWLLVMALTAIIIPNIFSRKSTPDSLKSNLWPWLGVFLLINVISSLLSSYTGHCFKNLFNPLLVGYAFIALNMIMISRKGFERYLPMVLAWSIGINAFLGFLGYFFGFTPFGGERGRGLTIGANNMALMSIFTIPLLVHWIFHAKTRVRASVGGILLIVNILGVISSESRGGFLSLTIVVLLILFELRHRFHPKYLGIAIALTGAVLIAIISFVPKDYIQRQTTIGSIGEREAGKSIQRREAYLLVAWDAFTDRPLLGSGTSAFPKIWVQSEQTRRFDMVERPAHNTYAEVLVGTGAVGFFLFMMLLWTAFDNFSKAKEIFRKAGSESMSSLTSAYQLSFLAVCIYFMFKSGLGHKLFLLSLPISQVALTLARKESSLNKEEGTEDV